MDWRLRLGRPVCLDRCRKWPRYWPCRSCCGIAGRPAWLRILAWVVVGVSVVIQLASLCFWLPLEIYQMETLGHPTFVIALRFKNIAAFALGKMSAWGLNNDAMTQDPWDYVHITCWNFLPFVLRRVGAAPAWVVNSLMAVWARRAGGAPDWLLGCNSGTLCVDVS